MTEYWPGPTDPTREGVTVFVKKAVTPETLPESVPSMSGFVTFIQAEVIKETFHKRAQWNGQEKFAKDWLETMDSLLAMTDCTYSFQFDIEPTRNECRMLLASQTLRREVSVTYDLITLDIQHFGISQVF